MTDDSADRIKRLRERTGAGIMDCKAALQASGGDEEKAIDFLRKKGQVQAAKRAGREAKEGLIALRVNGMKAAIIEANCETDFVARTDDFKNLALMALEEALAQGEGGVGSEKILRRIAELSGKIGEKLVIRRVKCLKTSDGDFFNYLHFNGKLGSLVEVRSQAKDRAGLEELGKNVAMQIANSNPAALSRKDLPPAAIEREKSIYREEVKGKPEHIVEKIIQGKLEKLYQSQCLLEQPFIKDDKLTISALLGETSKKLGGSVEIKSFVRFQLGEALG